MRWRSLNKSEAQADESWHKITKAGKVRAAFLVHCSMQWDWSAIHTYIWMHHGRGKLHETTTSPTYQEHSFLDRGTQLPMFTVKGCYLCFPGKPKYSNVGWHSTAILALTRQHETIQCTWILWHKLNVFWLICPCNPETRRASHHSFQFGREALQICLPKRGKSAQTNFGTPGVKSKLEDMWLLCDCWLLWILATSQ